MNLHLPRATVVIGALLAAAGLAVPMATPAAAAPLLPNAHFVLPSFGVNEGWNVQRHLRVLADVTGDGRADIVGFGESGVDTAVANGSGAFFSEQPAIQNDFAYNQGWRNGGPDGPRTPRFVTDITGDGRADIVGIGTSGVHTAVATGSGGFGPAAFWPNSFTASQCRNGNYMADLNADHRDDLICGLANGSFNVAIALGNGGFGLPKGLTGEVFPQSSFMHFTDVTSDGRADLVAVPFPVNPPYVLRSASPRSDDSYPATRNAGGQLPGGSTALGFDIADVNGDACADLIAFGTMTYRALGNCSGLFQPYQPVSTDFNYNWARAMTVVTDVTADRQSDIVGFGEAGVFTARGQSNGSFTGAQFVVSDFGYNQGWRLGTHPRYVADITGDGRADIVGFGDAGIYTAVGQGDGTFA
jgi:hypothetical protein